MQEVAIVQSPLGPYGNLVAAALAVIIVLAAVASHVVPGLEVSSWLDNAALIAVGVVFGTQVVQNGTQTKAAAAMAAALTANSRLDAMIAPTAADVQAAPHGPAPV